MVRYYVDSARRRADVVGKPAAAWELKGLDGKTHTLKDYRGKVVVLDFWYRGCGWCIKAMPQINALAGQFEGRPVTVLGMNTDRNEADAKFVSDAMGLKYATLRAEGIPEKYGVQGFPTLILIDPEGTVRDVHVGYSPTLQADVAKVIEGLLPRK
jgi:peroxiredoxin